MVETKSRLTPTDWIAAGFQALMASGPNGLKAEPLARALGTTKGSFYWHFKDVPDFQFKMLEHWIERALTSIVLADASRDTPTEKLYSFTKAAVANSDIFSSAETEAAIRAWGQSDPMVGKAVEELDNRRMAYLQKILTAMRLPNPDFARIVYGAFIGMSILSSTDGRDNSDAMSTLIASVRALEDA